MPYLNSLATQCATCADYTEPDPSENSATQYVGTDGRKHGEHGAQRLLARRRRVGDPEQHLPAGARRGYGPAVVRRGRDDRLFGERERGEAHPGAVLLRGYTDASGSHNDHDFCSTEVRPYSEFNPNALPDFSFVTPTLCNDGHDCSDSTVDAWASANVQRSPQLRGVQGRKRHGLHLVRRGPSGSQHADRSAPDRGSQDRSHRLPDRAPLGGKTCSACPRSTPPRRGTRTSSAFR